MCFFSSFSSALFSPSTCQSAKPIKYYKEGEKCGAVKWHRGLHPVVDEDETGLFMSAEQINHLLGRTWTVSATES